MLEQPYIHHICDKLLYSTIGIIHIIMCMPKTIMCTSPLSFCSIVCIVLFYIVPASSDIDCGDPGIPTNGDRHPFSTVYTSEVLYYCSMGYTLQGSDRRTCLPSGQWSGHLPQCNRMLFTSLFKGGNT